MVFPFSNIKGLYFTTPETSSSTIKQKMQEIGRNYISNGLSSIESAIIQFQSSPDKHLFGVFCFSEVDETKEWICMNVTKKHETLPIKKSVVEETFDQDTAASTFDAVETSLKSFFNEKSYNVTLNQHSGSLNSAMNDALEVICSRSLPQPFDHAVIAGLSNIRVKNQLKRFLPSLKSLLTTIPYFTMDRQRFPDFCKLINSKNFGPFKDDVVDLRVQILALIVQLKENGQIIDNRIVKNVFEIGSGFLVQENSIFLKQIEEFDNKLRENPRNVMTRTCLQFAINDRIEYLSNKDKLVPKCVTPVEIIGMFDHFVLENEIENLRIDQRCFEKTCVTGFNDIGKATLNDDDSLLLQGLIDDNTRLLEVHQKLDYLRVKFSIRSYCNFSELIHILASKPLNNVKAVENLLSKIFEFWTCHESQVNDIIKIVFALPKQTKIQNIPDEFYQYLTPEQLLDLTSRLSSFSSTFIDHLVTIIIENDQKPLRTRAFHALTGHVQELSDEVKAIIGLERKIQSDACDLKTDMLGHVMKNYRLTWNAFQTLTNVVGNDTELTIIETIIDNDIQPLPKFLVDTCKSKVNSNEVQVLSQPKRWFMQNLKNLFSRNDGGGDVSEALKMCELMIAGNYLKLCDVTDCLEKCLKNDEHREVVLNIILKASQSGEINSGIIRKMLETIEPRTALEHNCIKAVTKKETLIDVLKNSKKSIKDRKSALNHLVKDRTCHNDYLCQILVDLVIFEPKLRDDAFEAFLTVITSETWKICNDQFPQMVDALKIPDTRVSIKAINDACNKNFLQHNEALIDYVLYRLTGDDFHVKTDCISLLTNMLKSNQNPVWIQILLDIFYSEHDRNLKESILNLINNGFNLEAFDQSIQTTVHSLKTLLCDKIDETRLVSLISMIESGLVVSESDVEEVIRCLPNEEFTTVASECLWMIHSKQGLLPQLLQNVLSTINEHPKIINNQHVLALIKCRKMLSNQDLSSRVLQRLLELLDDDDVNQLVLTIFCECLTQNEHDPEFTAINHQFIEILKRRCLEMSNLEFTKEALKALILIDKSISCNDGFIRDFYAKFQPFLSFLSDASKTNLTKLISTKSNKDRIQLLHALTITVTNGYHLIPELFVQKSEDEWLKDLLIDNLVHSVISETGEWDEPALVEFLTEMKVLEVKLSQNDQRLEPVLECLVDSNLNNFGNLSETLFLLKDEDALQVFLSNSEDIDHRMLKMKRIFLKKRLPKFSSQELEKLLKHVSHYSARTIEKLTHIECKNSPETLIKFIIRVQSSLIDTKRQELFFDKITQIKDLEGLNAELSQEIIDHLVQVKQIVLNHEMSSVKQKLSLLLDLGWSIQSIEIILNRCKGSKDTENILSALDVIYEYKLKEYDADVAGKSLIEIINTSPVTSWSEMFRKIAIFHTFPGTYQKSVQQLFDEIFKLNSGHEIVYLKDRHRIQQDFSKVMEVYGAKSGVLTDTRTIISKYDKSLIKKWAQQGKVRQPSVHESIAVTMRAVEILNKFLPREIQILSLLCLLNPETNKGRLAQINTGEGKTTIIAMLAVIKALQGHTVDIITSSGELAKPQSIEMQPFYSLFDLTVAHNGEDPKDIKERYKANILYGAADAFQGDILRDEYSKQGTRNGRKCDLAIVDEVDSMLIDGKNHIVMLSSFMPAMNYLETLLAAIYIHIGSVANLIVERDGKAYLIERKNRINDDGSIMKDVKDDEIEITVSKKEFIRRSTELHIRRILRDTEGLKAFSKDEQIIPNYYVELSIPKHLFKLVTGTQLKKWIDSAIYAMFKCDLNKHYVLTEEGCSC